MGENICSEVTHKGFVSKIYKQLMQLNIKRTNNPIKKIGGRFKQIFLQRRLPNSQKTHEKMLNMINYHCYSAIQLCPTLFKPVDCSASGFSVHHYLLEFAQT